MGMNRRIEDFIDDETIIDEILDPQNRLIMLIGGADTGKTTLVECIADITSRQTTTAIVDLDMGQSHIGPPTTIAWGRIKNGFRNWEDIHVEDFYFTGALTPSGNLVPVLVGAGLITDRALEACKKVIIDTTGLISGESGRILKQHKIDLLSPDIIIGLERSWELQDILEPFINHSSITIHRISVPSSKVNTKGIQRRSQFRLERFRYYFKDASVIKIPYTEKGIRFISTKTDLPGRTGRPYKPVMSELKNRLVSFRDDKNRDMALGIIDEINPLERIMRIRTPANRPDEVSVIVIGVMGVEL
jgi:polynucleotide 5'-kinase involved in rRNA processing